MKTNLRLFAVALVVTSFALGSARTHSNRRLDGTSVPIIVTPQNAEISAGQDDQITITMNENVTSDTVVDLSSNSDDMTVPATVTVLSGQNTATCVGHTLTFRNAERVRSTVVTITASANGGEAQGTVTID